jgi:hypothetical protein
MTKKNINKVLSSTNLSATPYYPSIADCHRWAEVLNHIMFDGKLPKFKKVIVRPLRKVYAWCEGNTTKRGKKYCVLTVTNKFESFAAFYSILAHELCHQAEFMEMDDINHGRFFFSHKEMLKNYGIALRSCY